MTTLFDSFDLAGRRLRNRVAMAPLTRARSPGNVANERNALYYAQRATAGLIVSEGSPISREGQGYLFNPGLATPGQIEGWRLTTQSVHAIGGTIFAQLWHVGRVSHVSLQQDGAAPVSSSNATADGAWTYVYQKDGTPGKLPASAPRALATEEVARVVADFAQAAENAVSAGFDGAEIHGANGYLLEQFLNPKVNDRSDRYGAGNMQDRLRFTLEVVDAVIGRIGRERTAIRLSPYAQDFGMPAYDDVAATYEALVKALGERAIAYVHVMDHTEMAEQTGKSTPRPSQIDPLLKQFRQALPSTALMVAGSMNQERATKLVENGTADLIAFGRRFIANPDLVERMRNGWPVAEPVQATFYEGGHEGYVDYSPFKPITQ